MNLPLSILSILLYSNEILISSALLIECRDGYMGVNCSIKCRYPSYGKRCQSFCNCLEEDCEAATGCTNLENGIQTIFKIIINELFQLAYLQNICVII